MRSVALAVVLLCFGLATRAQAAPTCTVSFASVDFGSVDTLSGNPTDTTGTMQATCSGSANASVQLCVSLGTGTNSSNVSPRVMVSGSNSLTYDIYVNSARTTVWGTVYAGNAPPPFYLTLPSTTGQSVVKSWPMYFRVVGSQQTAVPGSYSDVFRANDTAVSAIYASSGTCPTQTSQGSAFNIAATVQANCLASADPLDFGSHGFLDTNVDSSSSLRVTCTPGTGYSIALGNGNVGTSATTRQMSNGSNRLNYALYSDSARSVVFGSQAGQTVAKSGSGAQQAVPVYGRVPPQVTPATGAYSDTVVVTLTY